jgi:4-amino-4-deoxy-L-arabinose transferase-like glycosyltransferase
MTETHSASMTQQRPGKWQDFRFDPAHVVAVLILAQILIWTLMPWLTGRSLPLDVVSDGLAWGHEWQWGYYKHPPLPSWEVEAFFDAFGDIGPYLLSQISIGLTYLFVYLLGRELMAPRWAAAGTLLVACVYYFSVPTPEFNHNVAQMPLWAAAIYVYRRAITSPRIIWWLPLGAVGGIALLTKYAAGVLLLTILLHMLWDSRRRAVFLSARPYLALIVCCLVVAPHLAWLTHNHFTTISYAAHRAGETRGIVSRVAAPFRFLLSQLLDISPALLVAALAGFLAPNSLRGLVPDEKLRFLAFFTFAPALLAAFLSLAMGLGLRDMWGAPMWNLTGLLIVAASEARWPQVRWPRLMGLIAAAFILLPAAYVLSTSTVPAMEGKPSRIQWPDRTLAAALETAYVRESGVSLRIVAADGWLGGLVAMRATSRPSVFTDGSMREAPWITPDRLSREGALVVWRSDRPAPKGLTNLRGLKIAGTMSFAWPETPKAQPLAIVWGIVPAEGTRRERPAS